MNSDGGNGWKQVDGAAARLEILWQESDNVDLAALLPTPEDPHYVPILLALIPMDQEMRWRNHAPKCLEEYLQCWPELRQSPPALQNLVEAECLTRFMAGEDVLAEQIDARFPSLIGKIDLERIRAEATVRSQTIPIPHAVSERKSVECDGEIVEAVDSDLPVLTGQFGTYELIRELGEGGFGKVHLARQTSPIKRDVAVKIIKPGMDTRQVLARFEAERQALAVMNHPSIAKVYDAGETDSGRSFFVMEAVAGTTVTSYCDDNRLTIDDRLRVFMTVCEGIQHAHQKGIIHRDIKPANVLVSTDESAHQPKIIDFGIAKALAEPLTEHSVYTHQEQLLGTPAYMSPEQMGDDVTDIDTRSDVYSLGVLLYELLTGELPFSRASLRAAGLDGMRQMICEVEPPQPSQRLSTPDIDTKDSATKRGMDSATFQRKIRGELDWIVMKALEKDRDRRYASAADLAQDVQRYLSHEPVEAGPPSAIYRLRKIARKHRAGIFVATLFFMVLMMAAITIATFAWNRQQEQDRLQSDVRANLAAAEAFLAAWDLNGAETELAKARVQIRVAGRSGGSLAAALKTIAASCEAKTSADEQFRKFQRLRQSVHANYYGITDVARETAARDAYAAVNLYSVLEGNDWRETPGFRELRPAQQAQLTEHMAEVLWMSARLEAEPLLPADPVPRDPTTVQFFNTILPREREDAIAGYRRALESLDRIERFLPATLAVVHWQVKFHSELGDESRASELSEFAETLTAQTSFDFFAIAESHALEGRWSDALDNYEQAIDRQPDHYLSMLASGLILSEQKRHDLAEAMLTAAIAVNRRLPQAFVERGNARQGLEKFALARSDFSRAIALNPNMAKDYYSQGHRFTHQSDYRRAIDYCTQAILLDPNSTAAYYRRGFAHYRNGDADLAMDDYSRAVELDPANWEAYRGLTMLLLSQGKCDDALANANVALELVPDHAETYDLRARIYHRQAQPDKARSDMEKALKLAPGNVVVLHNAGAFYWYLEDYELALKYLSEAIRISPRRSTSYKTRGKVYQKLGKLDDAREDFSEAIELAPHDSEPYALRAQFFTECEEWKRAIEDYSQAIELAPNLAFLFQERGSCYRECGDYEAAKKDFDMAVDGSPGNPLAYACRAELLANCLQEYEQAERDLDIAIQLDAENAEAFCLRAACRIELKRPEEALRDLDEAVRLEPEEVGHHVLHGKTCIELKLFDRAFEDLDYVIELQTEAGAEMLEGLLAEEMDAEERGLIMLLTAKAQLRDGRLDDSRESFAEAEELLGDVDQSTGDLPEIRAQLARELGVDQ